MKTAPRLLAIRSGKWDREKDYTPGYFLLLQHPFLIVGFASCMLQTDGSDATERVIETIHSNHFPVNYIFLKGITIAGLNFVDPFRLYEEFETPVIIITESQKGGLLEAAAKYSPNESYIRSILSKLPPPISVETRFGIVNLQSVGDDLESAKQLVYKSALVSKIPEPLRILRIISKALGEPPAGNMAPNRDEGKNR